MKNTIARTNIYLSDEEVDFHGENYQSSKEKSEGVPFEIYLENALEEKLKQTNRVSAQ